MGFAVMAGTVVLGFVLLAWHHARRWRGDRQVAGCTYSVRTEGGRFHYLIVGAPTQAAVEFEVRPEGDFDRLGKAFGIAVEGQVWHAAFDDSLYLVCDDPYVLKGLQFDAELPRLLLRLFGSGFPLHPVDRVVCRDGVFRVESSRRGDLPEPYVLAAAAAPTLQEITMRLDAAAGHDRPDRRRARAIVITYLACGLATSAGLLVLLQARELLSSLDAPGVASRAAAVTALLGFAGLALAWRGFARTSRAHVVLGAIALLGIPGSFVLALAAFGGVFSG
jgi:hypothetical protein